MEKVNSWLSVDLLIKIRGTEETYIVDIEYVSLHFEWIFKENDFDLNVSINWSYGLIKYAKESTHLHLESTPFERHFQINIISFNISIHWGYGSIHHTNKSASPAWSWLLLNVFFLILYTLDVSTPSIYVSNH